MMKKGRAFCLSVVLSAAMAVQSSIPFAAQENMVGQTVSNSDASDDEYDSEVRAKLKLTMCITGDRKPMDINGVYYFGIFDDAALTKLRLKKPMQFSNSSQVSVDLLVNLFKLKTQQVTFYFAEVDSDGNVIDNAAEGTFISQNKRSTTFNPDNLSDEIVITHDVVVEKREKQKAAVTRLEGQITSTSSNRDIAGSTFARLCVKGEPRSNTSIRLSWTAVPSADKYVVYGSKCGKVYEKITETSGLSMTHQKLAKGTYYKYMVEAISDTEELITSKNIYVATKGGRNGNVKKIKVKKKNIEIKIGKTAKIKASASAKRKMKKYRALSYESSNEAIAIVSRKGVVKGIAPGVCYVYVYAQNGMYKKVKVTVKSLIKRQQSL